MEKAIKKAIEGGYDEWRSDEVISAKENLSYFSHHKALLDPPFWQALGKAENKTDAPTGYYQDNEWWKQAMHKFIDHLAEGKDINSFFEELLK